MLNISLRESHFVGEIEPSSRNKRARLTMKGATPHDSLKRHPVGPSSLTPEKIDFWVALCSGKVAQFERENGSFTPKYSYLTIITELKGARK